MNPESEAGYKAILDRAEEITKELDLAKGARKIAVELAKALLARIEKPIWHRQRIDPPKPANRAKVPAPIAEGLQVHETWALITRSPGGLRGNYNLEDLIRELMLNHVWAAPTQKSPKKNEYRTFPFVVGVLSVLSRRDDLGIEFAQICQSGRAEAVELAAAAAHYGEAQKLDEMQKGMTVGRKLEEEFHVLFSRHVSCMAKAYREMRSDKDAVIEKSDLVARTIKILKSRGVEAYGQGEHALWTRVFIAAGVDDLEQERSGSRKSRHRNS